MVEDFSDFARQRIAHTLQELRKRDPQSNSYNAIARQIQSDAGGENTAVHPMNVKRAADEELRAGGLTPIVNWIERHRDKEFRRRLSPDQVFPLMGEVKRDFFYRMPRDPKADEWDHDHLDSFAGVYLCEPTWDANSFLPAPLLRDFFADRNPHTVPKLSRSLDIKHYISQRSLLILHTAVGGYYYAAEFPMAALFINDAAPLDYRTFWEGVGVASSNSIRVSLRECLTRVGKVHTLLIAPKDRVEAENPFELSMYLPGGIRPQMRDVWRALPEASILQLKTQYEMTIAGDERVTGTCQFELSPLPDVRNNVSGTATAELIYHRKPAEFMRAPDIHLVRSDMRDLPLLEKIVNFPLAVGELK